MAGKCRRSASGGCHLGRQGRHAVFLRRNNPVATGGIATACCGAAMKCLAIVA